MPTGEEISLKIGVDASEFSQGVRSASDKLEAFAHHGAQEFGRLGGAGRVVTGVLREISASAPKVGEALTIAFGAVGIAGIAYKALIDRANEYLKVLDEIGKKNAEPIFGEEKVAKLREDLEAIDKRLKESQRRQRLDPVSGAVESILEETDPKAQGSSARQMLRRFAADKDAANKVLEDLTAKAKLLTAQTEKLPDHIRQAKRLIEDLEKTPVERARDINGGFTGRLDVEGQRRLQQEHDDAVSKATIQAKTLTDKQQELGRALRITNEQFSEQDKKVQSLQKAIGELQKLLDKVDPGWTTRPLLKFAPPPGTFSLSASVNGQTLYKTGTMTAEGDYLKKLSSIVTEDGHARVIPANGK